MSYFSAKDIFYCGPKILISTVHVLNIASLVEFSVRLGRGEVFVAKFLKMF